MTDPGIPAFLDRRAPKATKPLIYTYTILNAYKNVCPHQMFRRYIKKDQKYVETPEMRWGNEVHSAFEHRLTANKPLPDNMRQWEGFAAPFAGRDPICEQKLGITAKGKPADYWGDDCWFRGKADTTVIFGESAVLFDWKTGGSKYEDPFELATGALMLKVHHPELTRVTGCYAWLKENRLGQKYDLSDFKKTWGIMNAIIEQIEQDRARGEFNKKQSGLCGWCSVTDCEHHRERK